MIFNSKLRRCGEDMKITLHIDRHISDILKAFCKKHRVSMAFVVEHLIVDKLTSTGETDDYGAC